MVVLTDPDPELVLLYCFCCLENGVGGMSLLQKEKRVHKETKLCSLPRWILVQSFTSLWGKKKKYFKQDEKYFLPYLDPFFLKELNIVHIVLLLW